MTTEDDDRRSRIADLACTSTSATSTPAWDAAWVCPWQACTSTSATSTSAWDPACVWPQHALGTSGGSSPFSWRPINNRPRRTSTHLAPRPWRDLVLPPG